MCKAMAHADLTPALTRHPADLTPALTRHPSPTGEGTTGETFIQDDDGSSCPTRAGPPERHNRRAKFPLLMGEGVRG